MNRLILIFFLLSPLSIQAHNGLCTIKKAGEDVYVSSRIDDYHEISYWFKKCMANDLFTFYRVSVTSDSTGTTVVNEAYSDNIGPFEVRGGGWCGGNHLFTDGKTPTAETFSIKLYADGKSISSDTLLNTQTVRLEVKNRIFNPLSARQTGNETSFTDTLCIESIIYTIRGNSIQVDLSHDYINRIPVMITKYYGMQSMFKGENQLLTPLGEYTFWTDIQRTDRFKKQDFPLFNRFIEKGDSYFQSSFLLHRGLGIHDELPEDDVIFIGNSWTKCYHKLIGNAVRTTGHRDSWSGVYTWIATPLLDTGSAFAYDGFIDGKRALFFSNPAQGDFQLSLSKDAACGKPSIIENTSRAKIKKKKDSLRLSCRLPGSVIISLEK